MNSKPIRLHSEILTLYMKTCSLSSQDTLQTGSELYILINVNIDQYGKKMMVIMFCYIIQPDL